MFSHAEIDGNAIWMPAAEAGMNILKIVDFSFNLERIFPCRYFSNLVWISASQTFFSPFLWFIVKRNLRVYIWRGIYENWFPLKERQNFPVGKERKEKLTSTESGSRRRNFLSDFFTQVKALDLISKAKFIVRWKRA